MTNPEMIRASHGEVAGPHAFGISALQPRNCPNGAQSLLSRLVILGLSLLIGGCSATAGLGSGTRADLLAPLTGGVISTVANGAIAERLSEGSKRDAVAAEFTALQSGVDTAPQVWRDARSGISGSARAGQPYRVGTQDCRPVTQVVTADGQSFEATGAACREPDGRWVRVG